MPVLSLAIPKILCADQIDLFRLEFYCSSFALAEFYFSSPIYVAKRKSYSSMFNHGNRP